MFVERLLAFLKADFMVYLFSTTLFFNVLKYRRVSLIISKTQLQKPGKIDFQIEHLEIFKILSRTSFKITDSMLGKSVLRIQLRYLLVNNVDVV